MNLFLKPWVYAWGIAWWPRETTENFMQEDERSKIGWAAFAIFSVIIAISAYMTRRFVGEEFSITSEIISTVISAVGIIIYAWFITQISNSFFKNHGVDKAYYKDVLAVILVGTLTPIFYILVLGMASFLLAVLMPIIISPSGMIIIVVLLGLATIVRLMYVSIASIAIPLDVSGFQAFLAFLISFIIYVFIVFIPVTFLTSLFLIGLGLAGAV